MSLSSLVVDMSTKLLQPTSTGQTLAFQPCCSVSAASSAYLSVAALCKACHGSSLYHWLRFFGRWQDVVSGSYN